MLAFLVDHQEENATPNNKVKNDDCFICKNDQDLFIKAMEKKKVIKCSVCQKQQHPICYNIIQVTEQMSQYFACIQCRILQNQPEMQKLDNVIGPLRVFPKDQTDKIEFKLSETHTLSLYRNQYNELCVYCMKLDMFDSSGKYQFYNWPSDNIVVMMNNSIQSYQLDSLCLIDKNDIKLNDNNTFTYNIGNIAALDQKHIIIGIGLVQVGNVCQVIEKIILNQSLTENDLVRQYKEWAKDLEIGIPMKDQITQTLIKWPARGKYCNHFTCIDMYTYLEFNLSNVNLEKSRWTCPTCQNKLYVKDIIFDKYLHKFIKDEIHQKIEPDFLSYIEEVICDQNGCLRIGDESQQKIQSMQLKKLLLSENTRIEKQMLENKQNYEKTIKAELIDKLTIPLQVEETSPETKRQLELFKEKYPKIDANNLKEIFESERSLILSLNPCEFVYQLMDSYSNLKELQATTHAELMYNQSMESIVQILQTNMKHNQIQFTLLRFYTEALCDRQESRYCSYVAQCISFFLIKKYKKLNLQIDSITPAFILLTTQYAIFENNISNTPPGILIGGIFYFFKSIMKLSLDRTSSLFSQFVNLTGHESFYLSQQPQSIDFLADTIYAFLQLQYSTNEPLNQVEFFQKIFIKQLKVLLIDMSNQSIQKQICLFRTINQVLFRQDPQYRQKPFKQAKEFISQFVEKDKAVINHLKTFANQIF